jgi:hypothetical protein
MFIKGTAKISNRPFKPVINLGQNGSNTKATGVTYSYYRRFIPSFSDTARPLNKLTEKTAKCLWTDECESSFNSLKDRLTQANYRTPILLATGLFGPLDFYIFLTNLKHHDLYKP